MNEYTIIFNGALKQYLIILLFSERMPVIREYIHLMFNNIPGGNNEVISL